MGQLASRSATQKLGQILGLLVIPMLVLWAVYFVNAKRDIDALTRGLQAIELAQATPTLNISSDELTAVLIAAGLAFERDDQNVSFTEKTLVLLPELAQKLKDAKPEDNNQQRLLKSEIGSTLNKLAAQLSAQRGVLWRNLIVLTLAGLICAFAGVGLSILMMRSTFLRLDEIESANVEAHAAKREAEQIALRFTTINNDISNLNQDLASQVKALSNAQHELLRKNRIEHLGQLTATIAHEIRNPLGAIRTSTFMLERKISKAGVDTGELIERINNSVNRCDSIISQLHDFAQIKEPNNALLKLDDWLSKVVREEATKLPPAIFIECSLGLENLQISFDPNQLQRAVVNILNNACEALLNDAQKDVSAKQKLIWVTTLHVNDHVVIRIADNGPGISSEHLEKIREPLFTTKSFGSGLGLPVVEQIVKMQGGHLNIASNPGSGAKISIHLPVSNRVGSTYAA